MNDRSKKPMTVPLILWILFLLLFSSVTPLVLAIKPGFEPQKVEQDFSNNGNDNSIINDYSQRIKEFYYESLENRKRSLSKQPPR